MKKNNKKATKPVYAVNLTNVTSPTDVKVAYIRAKATNGVKLDDEEVDYLIIAGVKVAMDTVDEYLDETESKVIRVKDDKIYKQLEKIMKGIIEPKKPWYKRFWAWMTKPFKKK